MLLDLRDRLGMIVFKNVEKSFTSSLNLDIYTLILLVSRSSASCTVCAYRLYRLFCCGLCDDKFRLNGGNARRSLEL